MNFALDYGQVQSTLLHELEIPYGVLDENGVLLWANARFKEIVDTKLASKGIANLFPELTKEQLPVGNQKSVCHISYKDYKFRRNYQGLLLKAFRKKMI